MYFSFLYILLHYPLVHRSCDQFIYDIHCIYFSFIYMMIYVVILLSLHVLFLFYLYTHVSKFELYLIKSMKNGSQMKIFQLYVNTLVRGHICSLL